MLGDRYGGRPLPTELEVEEFDMLVEEAKSSQPADEELLNTWYKCDNNAVPPVYVLQVNYIL